jgi:hypothetical protein
LEELLATKKETLKEVTKNFKQQKEKSEKVKAEKELTGIKKTRRP